MRENCIEPPVEVPSEVDEASWVARISFLELPSMSGTANDRATFCAILAVFRREPIELELFQRYDVLHAELFRQKAAPITDYRDHIDLPVMLVDELVRRLESRRLVEEVVHPDRLNIVADKARGVSRPDKSLLMDARNLMKGSGVDGERKFVGRRAEDLVEHFLAECLGTYDGDRLGRVKSRDLHDLEHEVDRCFLKQSPMHLKSEFAVVCVGMSVVSTGVDEMAIFVDIGCSANVTEYVT